MWRFYPLADHPQSGVLWRQEVKGGCKPCVADFLTPEQAKALADRKREKKAA